MPEILHGEPSRHMMSPLRTSDRSLEPLGAGLVARMYSSSWALSVFDFRESSSESTFVYVANRAGVRPGKADVTLTEGTLILKLSAASVNQRGSKATESRISLPVITHVKTKMAMGRLPEVIGCDDIVRKSILVFPILAHLRALRASESFCQKALPFDRYRISPHTTEAFSTGVPSITVFHTRPRLRVKPQLSVPEYILTPLRTWKEPVENHSKTL